MHGFIFLPARQTKSAHVGVVSECGGVRGGCTSACVFVSSVLVSFASLYLDNKTPRTCLLSLSEQYVPLDYTDCPCNESISLLCRRDGDASVST